mmetsp:Transcript_88987/g.288198  ORF Transcript_88987/g.288198 Transcript_88987/m.288198 type:complete len:312 (-) Transcript_88987:1143-2078(-)
MCSVPSTPAPKSTSAKVSRIRVTLPSAQWPSQSATGSSSAIACVPCLAPPVWHFEATARFPGSSGPPAAGVAGPGGAALAAGNAASPNGQALRAPRLRLEPLPRACAAREHGSDRGPFATPASDPSPPWAATTARTGFTLASRTGAAPGPAAALPAFVGCFSRPNSTSVFCSALICACATVFTSAPFLRFNLRRPSALVFASSLPSTSPLVLVLVLVLTSGSACAAAGEPHAAIASVSGSRLMSACMSAPLASAGPPVSVAPVLADKLVLLPSWTLLCSLASISELAAEASRRCCSNAGRKTDRYSSPSAT